MATLRALSLLSLSLFFISCSSDEPHPLGEPPAAYYAEKGRALAEGAAACGFCHGKKSAPGAALSGGQKLHDDYGEVYAPNLTPAKSGLKNWKTSDFLRLFRSGERPGEEHISQDLHRGYEWMSDEDLLSVFAYLKTLAPVENKVERRSVSGFEKNTSGFFKSDRVVTGYVPEIDKSYQVEFGKYLVDHVARCSGCHNTRPGIISEKVYLGGGEIFKRGDKQAPAPNITPSKQSGIGNWSEEQIVTYLETGLNPKGVKSDPELCPFEFFSKSAPEDLIAIAKYLKTVPAVE